MDIRRRIHAHDKKASNTDRFEKLIRKEIERQREENRMFLTAAAILRGVEYRSRISTEKIMVWDGKTDFDASHSKFFNFNNHTWTQDFLTLSGQPLLCMGIVPIHYRGEGYKADYQLAYHFPNVYGDLSIIKFVTRTDYATMRKELRQYLNTIEVRSGKRGKRGHMLVIDPPPANWNQLKPYYDKETKHLHFDSRQKLEHFIILMWGEDAVQLINKTATATKKAKATNERLQAFLDSI